MGDIADTHKSDKKPDYWGDLDNGSTTAYKSARIEELIDKFFRKKCESIVDIGSGSNCDHILKYRTVLGADRIACMDYDEKIIEQMKQKFPNEGIEWHVADIFDLNGFKNKFDLVFILDVLHEVYSFYGRPSRNPNEPVDHHKGLEAITMALTNIAGITNPGGGIIIADAVLPSEEHPITIRPKTQEVENALNHFFANYPTKKIHVERTGRLITLSNTDFSVLSRQYDKIKNDPDRWKVERLEQHQYMTKEQYEKLFSKLNFNTHAIIGTPQHVLNDWEKDFEIVNGSGFPPRRITILATKNKDSD